MNWRKFFSAVGVLIIFMWLGWFLTWAVTS